MSKPDLDAFLAEQRTCRVATASELGPHLTPLWYVWDGTALWLTSIVSSQRWTDLARDPRVAVLVDAGDDYTELRGVELRGRVEIVGEVPRTGLPEPQLDEPERLFARKYANERRHAPRRQARVAATDAGQGHQLGLQDAVPGADDPGAAKTTS